MSEGPTQTHDSLAALAGKEARGAAIPVSTASPAPVQVMIAPEQFRKIENLQRTIGKLSRRLTLMALLNLIILGLLGWSWYGEPAHQKMVEKYFSMIMPGKDATPNHPARFCRRSAKPPQPAAATLTDNVRQFRTLPMVLPH